MFSSEYGGYDGPTDNEPLDGAGNPARFDEHGNIMLVDGEIEALRLFGKYMQLSHRDLLAELVGFDNPEQEIIFLIAHGLIEKTASGAYQRTDKGIEAAKALTQAEWFASRGEPELAYNPPPQPATDRPRDAIDLPDVREDYPKLAYTDDREKIFSAKRDVFKAYDAMRINLDERIWRIDVLNAVLELYDARHKLGNLLSEQPPAATAADAATPPTTPDYRVARGVLAGLNDEPAEVSVRRLRDAALPQPPGAATAVRLTQSQRSLLRMLASGSIVGRSINTVSYSLRGNKASSTSFMTRTTEPLIENGLVKEVPGENRHKDPWQYRVLEITDTGRKAVAR